jgi:KGK domain
MLDRSKQIIPDSQAVVSCFDPEILEALDLHGTFIIGELLEMLKGSSVDCIDFNARSAFIEKLTSTIIEIIQQGHSQQYLMNKVSTFIKGSVLDSSRDNQRINDALLSGINCNLLQPDGKGWQKGKLKICFEFITEEPEPVLHQGKTVETQSSPLDEIRQLSNELASVGSIEQN